MTEAHDFVISRRHLDEPLYPRPRKVDMKKALDRMLEVLRRGKWFILGTLLLMLGVAALYTSRQAPLYQASSLLLMKGPMLAINPGNEALNYGYIQRSDMDYRALSSEILALQQSLPIAERVAARLLAMQTMPETGEPISMLRGWGPSPPITSLARVLQGHISVSTADEAARGAYAILVLATGAVPSETALLANLFAEEYVQSTRENSRQRISASRAFLEEQIVMHEARLGMLEEQIKEFQSQEKAMALNQEAQYIITQMAQLDATLDEARIELNMKEASLRTREQELEQIQPQLAQRVASGVEVEIERSQAKIAELELLVEQIYAQHPRLRDNPSESAELQQLNGRITQLRRHVARLSEQYVQESLAAGGMTTREAGMQYVAELKRKIAEDRVTISGARAKIEALGQRLAEYDVKLRGIPDQSLELAQLQRARQATEERYNDLVAKLEDARLAEKSEIGFAQILRPAFTPGTPVVPNPRRNLILGGLLGILLGIGIAFVRYKLDTRVYTPDDLRENGFRILGVIPDMRKMIRKDFRGASKVDLFDERAVSTILAPLLAPFAPASEAYRHLYMNLQFCLPDKIVQTLLITSPEAGAGKSTTAVNLALTIAKTGRRVLLVDADLRIPALHDYLGLTAAVSLETLLLEQQGQLKLAALATGVDNLFALVAREPVDHPAELLGSRRMRELIAGFKETFDVIIFDSPPLLAAADAMLLSAQCDATLVVASAGSTEMDALKLTVEELENVGATVVGTMLNRFDAHRGYAYRHTYGYRLKYYHKYQKVRS